MVKLTIKGIAGLLKSGKRGYAGDGGNLYFKYSADGKGSWIFRYKWNGKSRDMGLGAYPDIGLSDARTDALGARRMLNAGVDPLSEREAAREAQRALELAAEAKRHSFKSLALEYHQAHSSKHSEKWRNGWVRKMEKYAFPLIGDLPAESVDVGHVQKILNPLWGEKTRTADEVRGQIEQVLDAAKARGLREGENPARWRGNLEHLLSRDAKKAARQRQHFAAMKWSELPVLMANLRKDDTLPSFAAQLLILTGARAHMVRFARWEEFDFDSRTWVLSAERMKARKAFAIPLSNQVIDILAKIPRIEGSTFLFPGRGKSGVMHANAVRNLLHQMKHADITRHGFRSTFRDWASESTSYPREVCEMALAHDERDQTEGAYSRTDFLEKRRPLMQDWAEHASSEQTVEMEKPILGGTLASPPTIL
ncbi:integrase arm-type DNA-binding domain-containing protein [Pseudomonas viridiflava]|uniref:tyrosine-type recombinase/integrase n=1 Tax=Pseudomonas viridiflava TaxID=33069 RepID=UPI002EA2E911|nr:integrase arm-type DNA-binding domain-containing protein [Pseudomonas viridiflava]